MELMSARISDILKELSSSICNWFCSILKYLGWSNPMTYAIEIYKELEKPVEDEQLKNLMKEKHIQYMKITWNTK